MTDEELKIINEMDLSSFINMAIEVEYRDRELKKLQSIIKKQQKELETANHIASVEFVEHNFIPKEEYDKLKYEFDVLDKELERLEIIEQKYYKLKEKLK